MNHLIDYTDSTYGMATCNSSALALTSLVASCWLVSGCQSRGSADLTRIKYASSAYVLADVPCRLKRAEPTFYEVGD